MARPEKPHHPLHVLRVIAQLAFFGLFAGLVILTARGTFVAAHPYLAQLFLISDPLILVGALLAGGFTASLLAALVVVALSLVAPRAYCGWICPLGTIQDIVDKILFRRRNRSKNMAPRLRQIKYGLLVLVLVPAIFGLGVFGWFDPVCIATRSFGVAVYPMADHAARTALIAAEERGVPGAASAYDWARRHHLLIQEADFKEGNQWAGYRWAWVFFALLAAIVLVQAYQKRFWCRNLCPLGALLGLLGSVSPFRPRVSEKCTQCDRCRERCKMGAFEPAPGGEKYRVVVQECILCYACERAFCPAGAIHVGLGRPGSVRPAPHVLPSRRAFLGTALTGAVLGPAFLLDQRSRAKEESNPMLRPPGALRPDPEFLATCIRCGECMRVCPTNALHPSGIEDGIAGLWTPTFVYNIGYCDYFCAVRKEDQERGGAAERAANLCATVCPTGAIRILTQAEKEEWKIGTAMFDHNRCLPWARGESCLTCEEQCPVPEKAISHRTVEVANNEWLKMPQDRRHRYEELEARRDREGLTAVEEAELDAMPSKMRPLVLPYVLRERCTGCGICENVCPVDGPSGIRVERLQTQEIRQDESRRKHQQRRRRQGR